MTMKRNVAKEKASAAASRRRHIHGDNWFCTRKGDQRRKYDSHETLKQVI